MHHSRLLVQFIQCKKLVSYAYGQTLQSHYIQRLKLGHDLPVLLLFQFQPVYTCGLRRTSSIITSTDIDRLQSLGADFHETDRGGLLTFHGPGQLVAYPILPLQHSQLRLGLRTYISYLEQTLVETCREILGQTRVYPGIENGRTVSYAGAWVDRERKVAFMGIRYSRGITSHGISINCSIDMNWFDHIVPCGFERQQITSLTDENSTKKIITVEQITPIFLKHFQRIFNVDLVENLKEEILHSLNLSDATTETIYSDMTTQAPEPFFYTLSKETFASWKINGTIFVDNGTIHPSHSEQWIICGHGPSSSMSQIITISIMDIDYIDEDSTLLKISYTKSGKVSTSIRPTCLERNWSIETGNDSITSETSSLSWESTNSYYRLCPTSEQRLIKIDFLHGISCFKNFNITIVEMYPYEY
ncbi:hypothetical protein I4U23_006334 [Adineta vaga]|nr:hypothetical protein I4U23_006334 [Adineta vaga]